MALHDQLVTELDKLSPEELEDVLDRLTSTRARKSNEPETDKKKGFAIWLAKQHLGIDPHIHEVIYLPTDSPAQEIRLIEINTKLYLEPGDDAIVPVNMTPAASGLPYKVTVADITPAQWSRVQRTPGLLPVGWSLAGRVRTGRRRG